MARKRATRLSPEGLAYLGVLSVVLTAALIRDINLLLALFSILAGLAVLNWRLAVVTLRGLTLARQAPGRVTAGEPFEVDLVATSRQRRGGSWVVRITDRLERIEPADSGRVTALEAGVLLPRIPAGQSVQAGYRARITARGRYRLGPLTARTRFPLGLVERSASDEAGQTLLVLPRLGRLTQHWQRRQREAAVGARETERQLGTHEGEFHGLRDWRSGDSRRWIHWRTSARQNTLMVRQYEKQRHQDLTLLVELWQARGAGDAERRRVELAVSLAATIIYEMGRRGGGQLTLGVAAGEQSLVRGSASMALVGSVLESLAVAAPTARDLLPRLLTDATEDLRRATNTVIVSTRAVNLSDTERFAEVWNDPWKRPWLSGILCLDLSGQRWSDYFEPDRGEEGRGC